MVNRSLVMVLSVFLVSLGVVSSSSASEYHLTGGYVPFADCPLSDAVLRSCIASDEHSGELVVGHRTVPVDSPLTLQGGLFRSRPGREGLTFVGAEDGNTLSKAELSLPGGLAGILAPAYLPASLLRQFDVSIERGVTGATVTPELARPASAIELSEYNLLAEEGVAVQLPLKIKLSNPFLGSDCYIGSSTDPIVLNLTTGETNPPAPNKPNKRQLGPCGIRGRHDGGHLAWRLADRQYLRSAEGHGLRWKLLGGCGRRRRRRDRTALPGRAQHRDPRRHLEKASAALLRETLE
jgi:hypothetical protein